MPFRFLSTGLITAVLVVQSVSVAKGDAWLTDLESARATARQQQRPLLIHVFGDGCLPCMVMERTVLHQPAVNKLLSTRIVGVQINGNHNRGLIKQYGINQYPTDLLLSPEGRVLGMFSGKRSLDSYVGLLGSIEQKYVASRPPRRPEPKPEVTVPEPRPVEPALVADDGSESESFIPPVVVPEAVTPREITMPERLGLRGYSPVALVQDRMWVKGKKKFAHTHHGITYHMASAEELQNFEARPHQYAPRLLGCDPVLLKEENRAAPGGMKFGAFFDGELYLFVSEDSRAQFKTAPYRYSRTRHVILDGLTDPTRLR